MELQYPSRPLRFELELTTNCMNRCSICGDSLIRTKGVYMQEWKTIVDKIKSEIFNTQYSCSIRLTGGEPTLHPEFLDIVRYIDQMGISHGIFTTGCFDRIDYEKLFETYSKCNHFGSFLVSLHGSTAEVHETFTKRKGSFDEACKYIKMASNLGFAVVTNTVLTSYSANQIEQVASLSEKLGAKATLFERLFTKDGELEPTRQQLECAIQKVDELRGNGLPVVAAFCLPRCFSPLVKDTIKSGFEIATISTLGEVRPSNLTPYSFGNILEQSIEDIWESDKAEFYRNNFLPQCSDCLEFRLCRGGIKHQTNEGILSFDSKIGKDSIVSKRNVSFQLNPKSRLKPNFQLIVNGSSFILACHSSTIFVNKQALPIIDDINDSKLVAQISKKYGLEGLQFISYLHQNHFIELI